MGSAIHYTVGNTISFDPAGPFKDRLGKPYSIAHSPFGPFKRIGTILKQDPKVATGAGHHSVIHIPGKDKWYMVYHRRPLSEKDANHRVTCIDAMYFDKNGLIHPVKITFEGVDILSLKSE